MSRRLLGKLGWNAVGLIVFAVMVFPVFWMVTTAFKGNSEIYSFNPTWVPTLAHPEPFQRRDPPAVLLDEMWRTA